MRDNELRLFYDHVMRPAINQLLPNARGSNLAPDYGSEMYRSRAASGAFTFAGRLIGDEAAANLGNTLRQHIERACEEGHDLSWARGFFFLHQIRGVKDARPHDFTSSLRALDDILAENGISRQTLRDNPYDWYLDIGLELVSEHGESLAWRTDAHANVVHEVLGVDADKARNMTRLGAPRYYRDFTSHLTQVSGMRLSPSKEGQGDFEVKKIQMYQTDKAITANPAEGRGYHAKHVTLSQLLNRNNPDHLDKLYNLYGAAAREGVQSHARIELRVPYARHRLVFRDDADIDWRKYLVAVPVDLWW